MYLSRQLYEEALHIQFYLTLLDNYVPDQATRGAFAAVANIPSIRAKAEFCQRWTDEVYAIAASIRWRIAGASCSTSRRLRLASRGLFFFGAFAYVYFLRLAGSAARARRSDQLGVRDESADMSFAFEVIRTVRREQPELFDAEWATAVREMISSAVDCEALFAEDVLSGGVVGMTQARDAAVPGVCG